MFLKAYFFSPLSPKQKLISKNTFGGIRVVSLHKSIKCVLPTTDINNKIAYITPFHGSDHIIKKPIFGESKTYNDYGRKIYCTGHVELSREWACTTDGYANRYPMELVGRSILNLNAPKYNILSWLAILLENRKFNVTDDTGGR